MMLTMPVIGANTQSAFAALTARTYFQVDQRTSKSYCSPSNVSTVIERYLCGIRPMQIRCVDTQPNRGYMPIRGRTHSSNT